MEWKKWIPVKGFFDLLSDRPAECQQASVRLNLWFIKPKYEVEAVPCGSKAS